MNRLIQVVTKSIKVGGKAFVASAQKTLEQNKVRAAAQQKREVTYPQSKLFIISC